MKSNKALTAYVGTFVDELANAGVKHVIVSPGSRSTPLAMTVAEHPDLNVWIQVDERSAAFFGLGLAKASQEPVALICTSGTAAANYLPAIVEADLSRIPLVVITSDRPHELRDVGAPQTINQINMFANYVKWFVEMALPEETPNMLQYTRMIAGRAVSTAKKGPSGPVHINIPFREPLVPDLSPAMFQHERRESNSYVSVSQGTYMMDDGILQSLLETFTSSKKGLIVCGQMEDTEATESIVALAEELGYPIFADPLSKIRTGSHSKEWILDTYDGFLRSEQVVSSFVPEVVIRFGAMPVSKSLFLSLKSYKNTRMIVVDKDGGWRDPTLLATDMIQVDPTVFCKEIIQSLPATYEKNNSWGEQWKKLNHATKHVINSYTEQEELNEGQIIKEMMNEMPDQATIFTGNSMPIRDIDTFLHNDDREIKVMANRGANGIDGIISTALGASVVQTPLVLIIGDLSFFHDLNGLLATKLYDLNITIILVNNNGGGIFSFLPQSNHPKHFETLFGTPTDLDFSHAVQMHGGSFNRIENWHSFREVFKESMQSKGLKVIEVPTNRVRSTELHKQMWKDVSQVVEECLRES